MPGRGLMIVLEGSDGSGKTTQFNLLAERLKAAGYDVETFDFPQYAKESSYFVKQYLSGAFGPATQISPYTASLFYALDRYQAAAAIKTALDSGKIVLADRYAGANMAYQGAKFADPVEQRGFFVWSDNLEFQLLGIPRPDINIYLRVPAEVSAGLIESRGNKRDEHESDLEFLKKSVSTYDLLCQLFPKDFSAIECTSHGKLLGIPQISDLIWQKIKPLLPPEPPHNGHSAVVTLQKTPERAKALEQTNGDKLSHRFKNASLLLKLSIERQIRAVDPPGFSPWSDYDYRFYTPRGLPRQIETTYKEVMTRLGELHREMRSRLEKHYEQNLLNGRSNPGANLSTLLLPVTPMAALCSFKAAFSPRAVERVAGNLLAHDSAELQWSAQQLYAAARQGWPDEFKQPLESSGNPEPLNNIIAKLAEDKLSVNSGDKNVAKLLEALPRLEFDLLAESIYPYSSLSLDEISEEVSNWSYQQKYDSLKTAIHDDKLLEKVRYKFDVISDQLTLTEALDAAILKNVQLQTPSPRFGYEVPSAIEDAGIDELYLECFDESLKLFSLLQQADRDDLTVYATLLGHKLRWQFQTSASALRTLFNRRGTEIYNQTRDSLKEAVAEAHPLIWEVLGNPDEAGPPPAAPHQNRVKASRRRRAKPKKPNRSDK